MLGSGAEPTRAYLDTFSEANNKLISAFVLFRPHSGWQCLKTGKGKEAVGEDEEGNLMMAVASRLTMLAPDHRLS